MNKWLLKNTTLFLVSLVLYQGCSNPLEEQETEIGPVPSTYTFASRFLDDTSSIKYTGQVVRNLLITDIKGQIGTDAGTGSDATLESMMANDDADAMIQVSTTPAAMQTKYHDISTSELDDRLTASADIIVYGYEESAQTLIDEWIDEVVALDADAGTTNADGLELAQMIQKTLWGAVSYWQGTSKYMGAVSTKDNTAMEDSTYGYTAMEHYWDESFGYFGAARDYNTGYANDTARKETPYNDSNNDGEIDFKSEYNSGISVNAAKRDGTYGGIDYNFTQTIFDAYVTGRHLITNEAAWEEVQPHLVAAVNGWEKVIAATVVHYMNDTIAAMAAIQTDASADNINELNVVWAEMRAFMIALQFNTLSVRLISEADLQSVSESMGEKPPVADDYDSYTTTLGTLKDTMQATYSFSDDHMENW